ncbi:hypothetical protein BK136_09940 [Paenibacillus amylolyticus]|nr:hypothetical protein BK136_09940 [Paenibacillus amylolyticus]
MQILNFADTLVLEEEANKQETIKAISNQLELCNDEEVKMTYRVLNDIIQTFECKGYCLLKAFFRKSVLYKFTNVSSFIHFILNKYYTCMRLTE